MPAGPTANFPRESFVAENHCQVAQRDPAMSHVQPVGQGAAGARELRHPGQRQRLQQHDEHARRPIDQRVHASAKTNLPEAVAEVVRAAHDPDFDANEIDWQVAPVEFGKARRVFLRRDDRLGLALFAAVDGVQDFLLGEPVVVGEAFRVDEFAAEFDQALLHR